VGRGIDTQAAVSRDGRRITFAAVDKSFNLEVLPFDVESGRVNGKASPITTGNHLIHFHNFSPDGRSVVFDDRRGAAYRIWRVDLGSPAFPLTSDQRFDETYPRWSSDGATIAFQRRAAGDSPAATSLWAMSSDGSNLHRLAERAGGFAWLPNSRSLVDFSPSDRQLYLLDLAVTASRRLTNEPNVMPILVASPDGEWVAYQSTMSGNVDLRAVSTRGGQSRAVVTTSHQNYHPFFSPSGRWLYFFQDHRTLYRVPGPAQDWRNAAAEKVTDFPGAGLLIEDPQISPDGRQLLYSRGRITADLWVMTREASK
jgi:Tol biopolymer transport system component